MDPPPESALALKVTPAYWFDNVTPTARLSKLMSIADASSARQPRATSANVRAECLNSFS